MKRDTALSITGVTKHQYYYWPKKGKQGRMPSTETLRFVDGDNIERVSNDEVIECIKEIQSDPDTNYGYHKKKLARYTFWSLTDLQQCLTLFYEKYNNQRLHSSTLYLPPMVFWDSWEKGWVKLNADEKKRKIKFSLLVPYQQLSEDLSPRSPLLQPKPLDGVEVDNEIKEMPGAGTFQQLSVKNRPRLPFAIANLKEN